MGTLWRAGEGAGLNAERDPNGKAGATKRSGWAGEDEVAGASEGAGTSRRVIHGAAARACADGDAASRSNRGVRFSPGAGLGAGHSAIDAIDVRPIKRVAAEKLPRDSVLRDVILSEEDFLSSEEFLIKVKMWLRLFGAERSSGERARSR